MAHSNPFSAVLRIASVAISQSALETALRVKLDRYEPSRKESLAYAQVDIVDTKDVWNVLLSRIQTIGPQISALKQDRSIGAAAIDLAVSFDDGLAAVSITVPSHIAEIVGRYGIDIEISVYLTSQAGNSWIGSEPKRHPLMD